MLDPKKSLAIDAPPIVPYDDGFSTDSEDYTEQEATSHESPVSSSSTPTSILTKRAVVTENQSNIQRQQIRDETQTKVIRQPSKDKPQSATTTTRKPEENASTRAADYVKPPANGHLKPQEVVQTIAPTPNGKKDEEHCRNCKGYLTPLAERLKVMKRAALQQSGNIPPPSRQCFCCHITYPFVALTDESRNQACTQPRCYMCNWAVRAAQKSSNVGVKRAVDGVEKGTRENGNTEISIMATTSEPKNSTAPDNYCKSCKGKLPLRAERLKLMPTAEHPTRQCTCCFITLPLSSLTEKSRNVKFAKPVCNTCDAARSLASTTEDKTPIPTNSIQPNPEKTPEVIVIDEEDEEGEVLEQESCKCCGGTLIPPVKRVQMMKDAAKKLGGKKPPPSRQCACCRITYPSEALTKKSRKMTRVVPICHSCCQAGGPPIYEMLCTSDEFIEAFQVEDPAAARQFLKRKENGKLAKAVEAQRKRMKKMNNPPKALKKEVPSVQPTSKQSPKAVASHPINRPQKITGRLFGGGPRYHLMPMMARKSMPAARLIIGRPANKTYAALDTEAYAEAEANEGSPGLEPLGSPTGRLAVRKSMPAPRLTIGEPVNNSGSPQTRTQVEQNGEQHLDQTAPPGLPRSRTAQWLRQFELVDGNTARERRLEVRNESKEEQADKKRQRTE
ncbi:hypothetical protein L914_10623 [Phytophthora nicotianae]|uniref:Uncharacterized protein n=2 Tax=Phytophthora nicotianae TaxID=4792 RepID=V9EY67_PHYNI|nr:hypothetical protein F443_11061 [Phytophthora nicotianae P1569]ETM44100.1 hypothetical protein L914_10623 [Phytophthora nicotianae]